MSSVQYFHRTHSSQQHPNQRHQYTSLTDDNSSRGYSYMAHLQSSLFLELSWPLCDDTIHPSIHIFIHHVVCRSPATKVIKVVHSSLFLVFRVRHCPLCYFINSRLGSNLSLRHWHHQKMQINFSPGVKESETEFQSSNQG